MKIITSRATWYTLTLTLCIMLQAIVISSTSTDTVATPHTASDMVSDEVAAEGYTTAGLVESVLEEQWGHRPIQTAYDYKKKYVVEPALQVMTNPVIENDDVQATKLDDIKVTVASVASMASAEQQREQIASKYEAVQVIATGYYAGRKSTGKDPDHPEYGITYSGIKVLRDRDAISTIAADLSIFPLGTVLYIPEYGYGVVADIGSAVKGHVIDLYFDTIEDIYNEWGKKELEVFLIERGKGKITAEMFEEMRAVYGS